MKNKKAFEMNFAWIFSIIVGAVVLFLAIYIATTVIRSEQYEMNTETAAKLSILLDPLETSLESGRSSTIAFNSETRIYNECFEYGNFGKQTIKLSSKSRIGEEWPKPGGDTSIYNKYIFSNGTEQSQEFSVFTKPLGLPFKVSDLIFLSGQEYCFIKSPREIKNELKGLGIRNMYFTDEKNNCSETSKRVCFGQSVGCDISVYGYGGDYDLGYVAKEGKTLYYTGPLIYGALFSSPEIYECNVKRLMLRLTNLCLMYRDKIEIMEKRGCSSVLDRYFSQMISIANTNSSKTLSEIQKKSDEIEGINDVAQCKVF